jgi:NADH:ubiquinone oxidoreductase subunit 4 (subunit M)
MYLSGLIFLPIVGTILVSSANSYKKDLTVKYIALFTSVLTLVLSLFILGLFHHSTNQLQFVQEHYNIQHYNVYLSLDGISIYFVLLTTIIMPIALLSN